MFRFTLGCLNSEQCSGDEICVHVSADPLLNGKPNRYENIKKCCRKSDIKRSVWPHLRCGGQRLGQPCDWNSQCQSFWECSQHTRTCVRDYACNLLENIQPTAIKCDSGRHLIKTQKCNAIYDTPVLKQRLEKASLISKKRVKKFWALMKPLLGEAAGVAGKIFGVFGDIAIDAFMKDHPKSEVCVGRLTFPGAGSTWGTSFQSTLIISCASMMKRSNGLTRRHAIRLQ